MAKIIGGIGTSHTPAIGFAKDTNKQNDPGWSPIFEGFSKIKEWVDSKRIDVLIMIHNDHVTSTFFDNYSVFSLALDDMYYPADEGGGVRDVPPLKGHLDLAKHLGNALVADEFDMSFTQGKALDHGCYSPLSMLIEEGKEWPCAIIPLHVGVLQFPIPSAKRCFKLGKSLRKAIQSYPDQDLRVAVVGSGGLSHQVHGERVGFNNVDWDQEFLELLETNPEKLADMRIAEYATLGGIEGAEVIMWLVMRGALSERVEKIHSSTYLPTITNIGTLILEDCGGAPSDEEINRYQDHINDQLKGIENLPGSYPFTLTQSTRSFRLNKFLHKLINEQHRGRFINDFDCLAAENNLSEEEIDLVKGHKWLEMIRYGVIFFVLEKMAAVLGKSNLDLYAAFQGTDVETFLSTRNVKLKYSVAGGENAKKLDNT